MNLSCKAKSRLPRPFFEGPGYYTVFHLISEIINEKIKMCLLSEFITLITCYKAATGTWDGLNFENSSFASKLSPPMHGVCLEITLTNYLFSLRLRPASSGNTDTMKAPRVLMPRWRHALKLYHMKLTLACSSSGGSRGGSLGSIEPPFQP